MELIWIGVVILVIIIALVIGVAWMGMSSRMRRQGADRQQYKRPPHGSTGSTK